MLLRLYHPRTRADRRMVTYWRAPTWKISNTPLPIRGDAGVCGYTREQSSMEGRLRGDVSVVVIGIVRCRRRTHSSDVQSA